jgi:hypothetical protein
VDWLAITFFLLSIPASIGANLLTPRLVAYLERRKLIKSNRTQEQDLKAFRSIEAFKNGSRDRYPAYIAMAVVSVFFFIGSATCVILGALEHPSAAPDGETILLVWQRPMFIYLLAAIFFLVSVLFLIIIVETARRLDRFDEYKAELRKKWGDDVV